MGLISIIVYWTKSLPDCVKVQKANNVQKPILPLRMNLVLNDRNFARFAYGIFVDSRKVEFVQSIEKQKQKWLRDVGYFDGSSFGTVIKATHSTRYQIFHHKLVNRIITTNRFLKIINPRPAGGGKYCPPLPDFLDSLKTAADIDTKLSVPPPKLIWRLPLKFQKNRR